MKSDGYEQHEFTVDPNNGHKFLWRFCEKEFKDINLLNISEGKINSASTNYTLMNGIYHMIEGGEDVNFSWAVDVKTAFVISVKGYYFSGFEWIAIINERRKFLSKDLLEEFLWHIKMVCDRLAWSLGVGFYPLYLQVFANRIHGSCEKRLLARDLLQQGKLAWFEDLEST